MTVFEDAFVRAGINTSVSRLAVAANDILARFGISPRKAREEFCAVLRGSDDLLGALAEQYLSQRAADMRGENLIGGGHIASARVRHAQPAPAGQSVGGDGGQTSGVLSSPMVPPSPPPQADRGGQCGSAPSGEALPPRSAPKRSVEAILADCDGGRGHSDYASRRQESVAPLATTRPAARDPAPWRPPVVNKPRGLSAIAAIQPILARSVMDTYKVRGNMPIGDLSWNEAKSLARLNECEARVLRYITDHVANARPGALLREIVKVEVVENAIRLAAEADNAVA